VLLAVGYDAVESPGPVASPFASLGFAPWGAWPASLGPATIGAAAGGGAFRVSRDGTGTFAALYRNDPIGTSPSGLYASLGVAPGGMLGTTLVDPTQPAPPLFIAGGPTGELWGWSWELPTGSLHYAVKLQSSIGVTDGFACGTAPVFADGVPSGSGFLVAATSSVPFGKCGKGGVPGPDGVPNRVQLSRFDMGVPTAGDEIVGFGPILSVAMAPRADGGAWVVWLPTGDPAAAPPSAQRVDASGKLVGKPFQPGTPGESGAYAVGALGDALVFAQLSTLDPSAPSVMITVHGDAGPLTAASFQPPGGHFAAPELSVVGSPTKDALLVAWADAPPSGMAFSVHVARMTCLP
jgi:hypothetical protein